MKAEQVRKALEQAVGACTVAISEGAPVTVEKGKWRLVGNTVIAKVGAKDVLLSVDKIAKIEDTKQSGAAPVACRSRVPPP